MILGSIGISDSVSAFDPDAQAYFTANTAYITSISDKNAINNFFVGLKTDGVYSKIKFMILPIWGAAAGCKWNLVNPTDSNSAFRMTFSTGWTFSNSGMTPSNAYANTFFTPSVNGTGLNNLHFSYYSRTNNTTQGGEIGIYGPPYTVLFSRWSNIAYFGVNGTYPQVSNTNSSGLFVASRINSTTATLYRNNSILLAAASNSTTAPAYPLTIGSIANASGIGVSYPTDRQCSFSSIGDGLTDTEEANLYSRVQTLMTYFGIQV